MSLEAEGVAPLGSTDSGHAPADATPAAPSPEPVDTAGSGEGAEDQAETAVEELEFDVWGTKFKVPKGAIPDDIRAQMEEVLTGSQRTYTQKTQELAERAKALEAEQSEVQRLRQARTEALDAYSDARTLRAEVERLEAIDLNALWQSNPDQARQVSDAIAAKRAQFNGALAKLSAVEAKAEHEEQQAAARLMEHGRATVAKAIPGFGDKVEGELIAYAVKHGMPEHVAKTWPTNPTTAVWAWKAMKYDELQAKAVPAAKPAAPPANPVKAIAGRSASAEKDPDKMTDPEWRAWRDKQLAKRRA